MDFSCCVALNVKFETYVGLNLSFSYQTFFVLPDIELQNFQSFVRTFSLVFYFSSSSIAWDQVYGISVLVSALLDFENCLDIPQSDRILIFQVR